MRFKIYSVFWGFLITNALVAQDKELKITLREAIIIAQEQSLDALIARNVSLVSYWRNRSYKADLLPNVYLSGTMPSLAKSLDSYQVEDGSYKFVHTSTISENLSLFINQNIAFTGGQISFQSQLQRLDQLGKNKLTSYLSIPLSVTYSQPLITHNPLKWAKQIEPELFEEAKKQYLIDMENIALKTINYYFDLLLASVNADISSQNLKNMTELYNIALGKKRIGLISDNDLYQLELNKLNASSNVIFAKQVYENRLFVFTNYLRHSDTNLKLLIPPQSYHSAISFDFAKNIAIQNNPLTHSIRRKLLEAQLNISQAKSNRGFKADLFVSLGYTGSNANLMDSYKRLQDRQMVSLGVRVPILDWGKGKGAVKIAESQYEITKVAIEQSKIDFDQNLLLFINEYHDQNELLKIAQQADSIAALRYETAIKTFVMGQINVLDINSAQIERDNAKRRLINDLFASWLYYYRIRQITLFDFQNNTNISFE